MQWPPSGAMQWSIATQIQQANPSVNQTNLQAWLSTAPQAYQASTTQPNVNGYIQYCLTNYPR